MSMYVDVGVCMSIYEYIYKHASIREVLFIWSYLMQYQRSVAENWPVYHPQLHLHVCMHKYV